MLASKLKTAFGGKTNEQRVREWTRELRKEQRKIDMQIMHISRDEQKLKTTLRQAAAKNDAVAMRMIAKELVRTRKAVARMYVVKSQINSVSMQLQNQLAQLRVVGSLQKSGDIMQQINQLVKVRDVRETMQAMSTEMAKTGLIDEMMNDAIDDAVDEDISDSELEREVGKVVDEVMMNKLQGTGVRTTALPAAVAQQQQQQQQDDAVDEEQDKELQARLAALRDA